MKNKIGPISISTRVEGYKIIQEQTTDMVDAVSQAICDTADRHIRMKLIELGWTPPAEPNILRGLGINQKALLLWVDEHGKWESGQKVKIWGLWSDSSVIKCLVGLGARGLINTTDGIFTLSEKGREAARKVLNAEETDKPNDGCFCHQIVGPHDEKKCQWCKNKEKGQ